MDQISDIYNKRLLEYADNQEMFDIKAYVSFIILLINRNIYFVYNNRLNGQFTLDNIASCLFGIETNSLQNENITLINHLKKFFSLSLTHLFVLIMCKYILIKTSNLIYS